MMARNRARSGSTSARGYGTQHQRARREALLLFKPGQRCVRCDQPMWTAENLDLDHDDDDRSRYLGLAHRSCNRAAGARKGANPQTSPYGFRDSQGRWNPQSREW